MMMTDVYAVPTDPPHYLCAYCAFETTDYDEMKAHILTSDCNPNLKAAQEYYKNGR